MKSPQHGWPARGTAFTGALIATPVAIGLWWLIVKAMERWL